MPFEVAQAAAAAGRKVFVVGLEGAAEARLAEFPHEFIKWGQIGRIEALVNAHGARDLVMIGTVDRGRIFPARPRFRRAALSSADPESDGRRRRHGARQFRRARSRSAAIASSAPTRSRRILSPRPVRSPGRSRRRRRLPMPRLAMEARAGHRRARYRAGRGRGRRARRGAGGGRRHRRHDRARRRAAGEPAASAGRAGRASSPSAPSRSRTFASTCRRSARAPSRRSRAAGLAGHRHGGRPGDDRGARRDRRARRAHAARSSSPMTARLGRQHERRPPRRPLAGRLHHRRRGVRRSARRRSDARAVARSSASASRFLGVGGARMAALGLQFDVPAWKRSPSTASPRRSSMRRGSMRASARSALAVVARQSGCAGAGRQSRRSTSASGAIVGRMKPDIPIVDYVSPTVWAYFPGRARKMARYVDRASGDPAVRAGGAPPARRPALHLRRPSADRAAWRRCSPAPGERAPLGRRRPVLLVLPGSRRSEIAGLWIASARPSREVVKRVGPGRGRAAGGAAPCRRHPRARRQLAGAADDRLGRGGDLRRLPPRPCRAGRVRHGDAGAGALRRADGGRLPRRSARSGRSSGCWRSASIVLANLILGRERDPRISRWRRQSARACRCARAACSPTRRRAASRSRRLRAWRTTMRLPGRHAVGPCRRPCDRGDEASARRRCRPTCS